MGWTANWPKMRYDEALSLRVALAENHRHPYAHFFSFIYTDLWPFFLWNFTRAWIIVHIWISSKCHWTVCPVPDFSISQTSSAVPHLLVYSCISRLALQCPQLTFLIDTFPAFGFASQLRNSFSDAIPSACFVFIEMCHIPHFLIVFIIPHSIMKSVCVYQSFLSFRLAKILLISRACMLTKLFKELEI